MNESMLHNKIKKKYNIKLSCIIIVTTIILASCSSIKDFSPSKKYAPTALQQDFDVLWQTYQQVHPSYNWYASTDSVDAQFAKIRASLTDSLNETQFMLRLAYATAAIKCGHTSILNSKIMTTYAKSARGNSFPFDARVVEGDSLIVTNNKLKENGILVRGDIIESINGIPAQTFVRQMETYISNDGNNPAFSKEIVSRSFSGRFKWIYGLDTSYTINYLDSNKIAKQAVLKNLIVIPDSLQKKDSTTKPKLPTLSKKELKQRKLLQSRALIIDSTQTMATIRLNTFSNGRLRKFFKQSFKTIEAKNIKNLVIDVSSNGGGKIQNSIILSRYLTHKSFKVADSISAKSFEFPYPKNVQASWYYKWLAWLTVHKEKDGRWHMGVNEKPVYFPKQKNHFDGNLYVLTGGYSFSASTLFLQNLKGRQNYTVVGTETGGGARGNSAVNTPIITLPNSKIRARLPLFRLVTDYTLPHNGRGYIPDIILPFTSYNIRHNIDARMEYIKAQVFSIPK